MVDLTGCILHCSFAQPHRPLAVSWKSARTLLRHHIARCLLCQCPTHRLLSNIQHAIPFRATGPDSRASWIKRYFTCIVFSQSEPAAMEGAIFFSLFSDTGGPPGSTLYAATERVLASVLVKSSPTTSGRARYTLHTSTAL